MGSFPLSHNGNSCIFLFICFIDEFYMRFHWEKKRFLCFKMFKNHDAGGLWVDILNRDRYPKCCPKSHPNQYLLGVSQCYTHPPQGQCMLLTAKSCWYSEHLCCSSKHELGISKQLVLSWEIFLCFLFPVWRYFWLFPRKLGNSTFVLVITWECWGKQQRSLEMFWRVIVGRRDNGIFQSSWQQSDVCMVLIILNQLFYHY